MAFMGGHALASRVSLSRCYNTCNIAIGALANEQQLSAHPSRGGVSEDLLPTPHPAPPLAVLPPPPPTPHPPHPLACWGSSVDQQKEQQLRLINVKVNLDLVASERKVPFEHGSHAPAFSKKPAAS